MINQLILDIKQKLNIQGGVFVDSEIEEYVSKLRPSEYGKFFKELSGEEYAFKKGIDRVAIVYKKFFCEPESDIEHEARIIVAILHDINKVITKDSQAKGEDYVKLMAVCNIAVSFNLTQKQVYVMNDIGGRELIMKINETEPNMIERKTVDSIKKYEKEDAKKAIGMAKVIMVKKKD